MSLPTYPPTTTHPCVQKISEHGNDDTTCGLMPLPCQHAQKAYHKIWWAHGLGLAHISLTKGRAAGPIIRLKFYIGYILCGLMGLMAWTWVSHIEPTWA